MLKKSFFVCLLPLLLSGCFAEEEVSCRDEEHPVRLGETWTKQSSGSTGGFNAIVWAGTRFVVLGSGPKSVLVSEKGVDWRVHPVPVSLTALAWSGNRACRSAASARVVGVGANGAIASSPDGLSWTAQALGVSTDLAVVHWTGKLFVAAGGDILLTSPDGKTWTQRAEIAGARFRSIASDGNRIVAVGKVIATSADGEVWELPVTVADSVYLDWVIWTGRIFLANNPGVRPAQGGYTYSSQKGVAWTKQPFEYTEGLPFNFGTQVVSLGGIGEFLENVTVRISSMGEFLEAQSTGVMFLPGAVAWNGKRLVVVGSQGTIVTSP